CSNGVILPAGVNQIVCDGVPAGASDEPDVAGKTYGFHIFVTLSEIIRCNWMPYEEGPEGGASGGIVCEATEAFFTLPVPQGCDEDEWNGRRVWVMGESDKGVCSSSDLWGFEEEDITPQVLEYGTSITDYQWACLSEVDGLTCWNIETFHGFKLSESEQLIW
ncbi:MAG: hypothetical protein FWG47_08725, partial [Propionibacteriaceae bacterium]|nr:hypothetical protein [Propionibacteriaceae bacterium]